MEEVECGKEVEVVEVAEVVKPGNKRKVCSAAAGCLSCEVRMRPLPGRMHAPGPGPVPAPACAHQALPPLARVLQPARGFQARWLDQHPARVEQRIAGGARARASGMRG